MIQPNGACDEWGFESLDWASACLAGEVLESGGLGSSGFMFRLVHQQYVEFGFMDHGSSVAVPNNHKQFRIGERSVELNRIGECYGNSKQMG